MVVAIATSMLNECLAACAPWLFEGPMDGEMFLAWMTQGLAPALRPGDVVILDNLATHKIRGVREVI